MGLNLVPLHRKMLDKNNALNCWKILKLFRLQRRDETSSCVNAAKAEKIE